MKYLIILFFLLLNIPTYSQKSDRNDLYYKKVKEFYHGLLNDRLTLDSVCNLFGEYSLEAEEYLFFEKCDKDTTKNCVDDFKKKLNNPSKYTSVFFSEIVKHKKKFFYLNMKIR